MKIYLKLSSGRYDAIFKEKKRTRIYGLLGIILLVLNLVLIAYQLYNQISYRQKIRQNQIQINLAEEKIKALEGKISKDRINLLARRVAFYNQVIQEDTFPWMPILYKIETSLIPNITLTNLRPSFAESKVTVEGLAISNSAVADFIRILEQVPDFGEVYPLRQAMEKKGKEDEGRTFIKFALVIYYQSPAAAKMAGPGGGPPPAEKKEKALTVEDIK